MTKWYLQIYWNKYLSQSILKVAAHNKNTNQDQTLEYRIHRYVPTSSWCTLWVRYHWGRQLRLFFYFLFIKYHFINAIEFSFHLRHIYHCRYRVDPTQLKHWSRNCVLIADNINTGTHRWWHLWHRCLKRTVHAPWFLIGDWYIWLNVLFT